MTQNEKHDDWTDCQGGEIAGLSQRLRRKREFVSSRRRILKASITAAMLVIGVGLGMVITQLPINNSDDLVCAEVAGYTGNYFAHNLDPEIVDRIEKHLEHCELCREHYANYQEAHPQQLSIFSETYRLPVSVDYFRKDMQGLVQDYQGIQLDRFFGLTVEGMLTVEGIKLRNSTMVDFLNSQSEFPGGLSSFLS